MTDLNLDEIYKAWEDATGKSVEDNRIRLNSDESFHIGVTIALSKRKYNEIIKSTN